MLPVCPRRARPPAARPGGFTLIEMMVVVAIIAVLAGITFATMSGVGRRSAAQNASHDLGAMLSKARARAIARGSDVWVIVYPQLARTGSAVGPGAYFVYEDPDLSFNTAGGVAGELKYTAFTRDNSVTTAGRGQLLDRVFLDDYSGEGVSSGTPPDAVGFTAPFTALNAKAKICTFCSGDGAAMRGAIVFDGYGAARFINATGAQDTSRVGGLTLINPLTGNIQQYLFGIAAGTGYVEVQRP